MAGLIGANAIIDSPLSKEKLLELAIDIEGHPDNVVPSLLGGLCLTVQDHHLKDGELSDVIGMFY